MKLCKSCLVVLLAIFGSLPTSAAPEPIFDGKSLAGWEGDLAWWRVEDGEIRGGSFTKTVPSNQFLATEKSYQNFDLRIKLRLTGTGFVNSGIQMRSIRVPKSSEMSGYQVDYGKGWYGKLYDESRRNKVIADSVDPAAVLAAVKDGEWNEYRIRTEGKRIQTWVNGVPALDYTEADVAMATDGKIGIQIHSGGKAEIQAKDIFLEELPATPAEMTWAKVAAAKPVAKEPPVAAPKKKDLGYNAVTGSRRSAEEQQKLFHLPEGFEIELFAKESAEIGKFIMLIFDQQGRAWSSTALEYPVDANENPAAAEALYKSKARDKVIIFDQPFASGVQQPRVFADGLAIPEGVLPYKNGAIVQHGHDVVFLRDTDGDGKADQREVLLTGFGVQDSHLFPHQFTRAPGGWFWLAQGAFNSGKVTTSKGVTTDFPSTRMARFRPDGSFFEPTSTGPCNIWGLVLTGQGESFIQEANDYGYPVMPFHEYAWYPGCADRLAKSYQPPFPVQAPKFKMGGTGLSGLALSDLGVWPKGYDDVMYVANPITSKINALKMSRDGPGYALEKLADLVTCEDPFFRPVALTMGPDGCLYIVDWYNKIISHNEVARNHPDRDKQSGRIWRVKPKGYTLPAAVDYTKLPSAELIARLGGRIVGDAHLAWQTLVDRAPDAATTAALNAVLRNEQASDAQRIQALWVLQGQGATPLQSLPALYTHPNRNVRREAVNALRNSVGATGHVPELLALAKDADPEVRAAAIKTLGEALPANTEALAGLLTFVQPSLEEPKAPDRSGKPARVGVAYDREFERFLVRMYLERHPAAVAAFMGQNAARFLTDDQCLFAILTLEPKASALLLASMLPNFARAPSDEELLRVAQFAEEPACAAGLQALLAKPTLRADVVERLLGNRTKLDPEKVGPLLSTSAQALLNGDDRERALAISLIGGFQLTNLEPALLSLAKQSAATPATRPVLLSMLQALQELRGGDTAFLLSLLKSSDEKLASQALATLVASRDSAASAQVLLLLPGLDVSQRRQVLTGLSGTKAGAKAIAAAVIAKTVAPGEIDGSTAEKLALTLGEGPELAGLVAQLGTIFRPVLVLDGSDAAVAETKLTLKGAFTFEFWIRLAPGIDNNDGVLGAPQQIDVNFAGGLFRVYAFAPYNDVVIAKKPITPELWTHYAVTRDAQGNFKIYTNGELDGVGTKAVAKDLVDCNVGWTVPKKGTEGALAEYRVWNVARTATEIRANFTRTFAGSALPPELTFYNAGGDASWGQLQKGAKVVRTTDLPPLVSEAQFLAFEKKNAHYMELGRKGGNVAKGKALAQICQTCHTINAQGGQIGPNLSGAGAMGLEGVIRNIMDPNAAMEAAYRVFRLELRSGEVYDAFYVTEDAKAYVIRQTGGGELRVPKVDVRTARYLRRSLMPEGLLDALNDEQVSDLLAYLMTLK